MNKLELRGALALLCEICDNEAFDYQLASGDWTLAVTTSTILGAIKQIKREAGIDDTSRRNSQYDR